MYRPFQCGYTLLGITCFAIIYNSFWLSILEKNNWEYLWMLGINLYKLPLTVRGYECGPRQKKKKKFAREEKKGGKGLPLSSN